MIHTLQKYLTNELSRCFCCTDRIAPHRGIITKRIDLLGANANSTTTLQFSNHPNAMCAGRIVLVFCNTLELGMENSIGNTMQSEGEWGKLRKLSTDTPHAHIHKKLKEIPAAHLLHLLQCLLKKIQMHLCFGTLHNNCMFVWYFE